MGLPVIATDVPGCRNIVRDGFNGLLCEAKNIESLRKTMQKMLMIAPAERTTMGENGRSLVSQKYDEKLVVDAAIRAVESAMMGK